MFRSTRVAVVVAAVAPLLAGVLPAHAAGDDFYTGIDIPSRNPRAGVGIPFLVTGHVRGSWTTPISRVEVTTDDGRTWHPAEGTTQWRSVFTSTEPGAHVTGARAYNET